MQESKREERKKLADEDAQMKIKKLEEQTYSLQKQVASQKQVDRVFIQMSPFVHESPLIRENLTNL